MEIDEVSEILGVFRALRAPRHVFITEEPVKEEMDGQVFYRGLQPRLRSDIIFLTRDADASSPIHESVHANFNLEEVGTDIITGLLLRKYAFLKNHPLLRSLVQRNIRYLRCQGCGEFAVAHSPRFSERVEHYVKA